MRESQSLKLVRGRRLLKSGQTAQGNVQVKIKQTISQV